MRKNLALTGAVVVVCWASLAAAQFNAPLRMNEGPGIKLTDSLVFHPGLAVEGRYDSNVFYTDKNVGAPYLRIIGHLDLATLPPQRRAVSGGAPSEEKVSFRLKTAIGYREYLSGDDNVKQQRGLEVDAGLGFAYAPSSVFKIGLFDDFARTVTARNAEGPETYSRDTNRGGTRLTLSPGGGRLTFALGYALGLDRFEDAELAFANKLTHQIAFEGKWRLLPKTALVLEVMQDVVDYYDGDAPGAPYINVNSKPFRGMFGLLGMITPMLSTTIKLGYGNSLHETGSSYNSVLALVELGLRVGPLASIAVGYAHEFQDSMVGNFFTDERAYLRYDHLIASRFALHVGFEYRYRGYAGMPALGGSTVPDLTNHLVNLDSGIDYRIQDWLFVGIGYELGLRSQTDTVTIAGAAWVNDYAKHQVFGKVEVAY